MRVHISNRADCAHELPADAPATTKFRTQSQALLDRLHLEQRPYRVPELGTLEKIANECEAFLAAPIQANNNKIMNAVAIAIEDETWKAQAYLYRLHRGYQLRIEPNDGKDPIILFCTTKNAARAECIKHKAMAWNF